MDVIEVRANHDEEPMPGSVGSPPREDVVSQAVANLAEHVPVRESNPAVPASMVTLRQLGVFEASPRASSARGPSPGGRPPDHLGPVDAAVRRDVAEPAAHPAVVDRCKCAPRSALVAGASGISECIDRRVDVPWIREEARPRPRTLWPQGRLEPRPIAWHPQSVLMVHLIA